MKTTGKVLVALVVGFALMASPGFAADKKYSGFLGEEYGKLQPGPEGGAKERWLKPDTDFAKYKKLMVDSVIFFFAEDSGYKGIDPQEMKELADAFNLELVNALQGQYPIVAEPGPDVARLRVAITDIKETSPIRSTITSIVPVGIAISLVKKGVTGGWTAGGITSAEFEALDSVTNEVIALAADQYKAGFLERGSKWGSAKEAFKVWAGRVKKFMDDTHPAPAQ
jgi:hypothetical protein